MRRLLLVILPLLFVVSVLTSAIPQTSAVETQLPPRYPELSFSIGKPTMLDDRPSKLYSLAPISSKFIDDITIPDGAVIRPGPTGKTWRILNDGIHDWPDGCVLVIVIGFHDSNRPQGSRGIGERNVPLPALKAGEQVDVTVRLDAPADPGTYTLLYETALPGGFLRFGEILYVIFKIARN